MTCRTNISRRAVRNRLAAAWLVQRGVEIISEASRHLTDEMKARHPEILWQKVTGIGNVLRHNYEKIAVPVIWKLSAKPIYRRVPEKVCRIELDAERRRGGSGYG